MMSPCCTSTEFLEHISHSLIAFVLLENIKNKNQIHLTSILKLNDKLLLVSSHVIVVLHVYDVYTNFVVIPIHFINKVIIKTVT